MPFQNKPKVIYSNRTWQLRQKLKRVPVFPGTKWASPSFLHCVCFCGGVWSAADNRHKEMAITPQDAQRKLNDITRESDKSSNAVIRISNFNLRLLITEKVAWLEQGVTVTWRQHHWSEDPEGNICLGYLGTWDTQQNIENQSTPAIPLSSCFGKEEDFQGA